MEVSQQFRLVFLLLFCTNGFGEERDIYLVMVEGDPPVAFLQDGSGSLLSGEKLDADRSSEILKARHAKQLEKFHDQLLESSLEEGGYKKLYSFKHIVNGFAVHTTPTQADKLKKAPGVKLIEKDRGAKMMTTHTPTLLGLPQRVWHTKRPRINAGQGIVIGFVDTGINPLHPSFANDHHPRDHAAGNITLFQGVCQEGPMFPGTSCNGKIISARFFSAGAEARGGLNASVDILSPYDAVGHGSHVASTAAGNYGVPVIVNGFNYGRASGMAPCARIAVYKAIYPSVGTSTDVLAAIDQAIKDGVDILTLSIGPDEPSNRKLTMLSMFDIFMLFARKAGVLVVQAAGNRGPDPYTIASYSPWAIGVAACDTDRTYPGSLLLGNGQKLHGIGLSAPTSLLKVKYKLVLAKDAAALRSGKLTHDEFIEECQHPEALDPVLVQQSIVICMFSAGFMNGSSSIPAIMNTAKTLGFAGFVFVANPAYGDFIADSYPFSIPGIMIPKVSDAQIIIDYYEKQTERNNINGIATAYHARAAIGEGRVASYNEKAPVVSRFSSRGPNVINAEKTPLDLLKPDIIAPGHNIWAAWSPMSVTRPILSGYNFGLVSGTSMAAPHIAGIAALIKQRYPSWTPSMISSAMATTATAYDNRGEPIMAHGQGIYSLHPSTHFDHGAGLVRPAHAIDPGLVFMSGYDDYMSFLCSLPNTDPEVIKSAIGETCAHSFNAPSDLNTPSLTISALTGSRSVKRTVKNVANEVETYVCAVAAPTGVAVAVNPPWFTIPPQGTQDLEVMLNVTQVQDSFRHGEIVLTGNFKHIVRIPLSLLPVSVS